MQKECYRLQAGAGSGAVQQPRGIPKSFCLLRCSRDPPEEQEDKQLEISAGMKNKNGFLVIFALDLPLKGVLVSSKRIGL